MERADSPSVLDKICLALLAAVFAGVVFHAPLSVWLGTLLPDFALVVKAWKEILLVIAACLLAVSLWRSGRWREAADDRLLWLIGGYALLHLALLVVFPTGFLAAVAGLMIDLRYLLFFALIYLLLRRRPEFRRPLLKAGAIAAAAAILFAALQALVLPPDILRHIGYGPETIMPYLTIDQNPDYVRINGTLRGPNPLGAFAAIALALLAAVAARGRLSADWRWRAVWGLAATVSAVALWASYSRSALVAAVVAVVAVLALTAGRRLSRKVWIAGLIALGMLIGGLAAARESEFVSHVLLHEDPGEANALNSNEEHLSSLSSGMARMLAQPLGAGVGSTGSASLHGDQPFIIENQYLFIAHESGWLGLGLFVWIFGLITVRLWHRRADYLALGVLASGFGLALVGLLLPVWADDTVSLVWWGLAAIALAAPLNKKEET